MASFTRLSSEQMETLSEIVFGLTITFSAIQFAFNPPSHIGDILSLVVEFSISFTLLIWVWITYIRIMRNLRSKGQPSVFLNVALLLCATVEPYLLYTVWLGTFLSPSPSSAIQLTDQLAAAAWSVDVALILMVLAAMAFQGVETTGLRSTPRFVRSIRNYTAWFIGCGLALIATTVPVFWVILFQASYGDDTVGFFSPIIHLALALWVPIFIAFAIGSWYFGAAIDRALDAGPEPGVPAPG